LTTGKGKRLILADTEEVRPRDQFEAHPQLHQRITELELALAQAQAKNGDDPHPLLASPYLFTPQDREKRKPPPPAQSLEPMPEEDEILDGGLGTLTISSEGEARFVGSFAGSEYLRGEDEQGQDTGLATPPTSAAAATFGPRTGMLDTLGNAGTSFDLTHVRDHLPKWESEGRFLVDEYWSNVDWMWVCRGACDCKLIAGTKFSLDQCSTAITC
jgi:hypothetical protein